LLVKHESIADTKDEFVINLWANLMLTWWQFIISLFIGGLCVCARARMCVYPYQFSLCVDWLYILLNYVIL